MSLYLKSLKNGIKLLEYTDHGICPVFLSYNAETPSYLYYYNKSTLSHLISIKISDIIEINFGHQQDIFHKYKLNMDKRLVSPNSLFSLVLPSGTLYFEAHSDHLCQQVLIGIQTLMIQLIRIEQRESLEKAYTEIKQLNLKIMESIDPIPPPFDDSNEDFQFYS